MIFILSYMLTGAELIAQCSPMHIINLRKTALVFGQTKYVKDSLSNAVNDALDIKDSLERMGFEVFDYYNTTLKEMQQFTQEWTANLDQYDVALFYFAGHGGEIAGLNYLYPIDANPTKPFEVPYTTFSANQLMEAMDNSNVSYNIMILDACRTNPFTRGWSRSTDNEGLAAMQGKGTFIAYAAAPGKVALDGYERNGTYTESILKFITVPDISIEEMFNRVNRDVRTKTEETQIPFIVSSLSRTFCFSVQLKDSIGVTHVNNFSESGHLVYNATRTELAILDSNKLNIYFKNSRSLVENRKPLHLPWTASFIAADPSGNYYVGNHSNRAIYFHSTSDSLRKLIDLPGEPIKMLFASDQKAFVIISLGDSTHLLCNINIKTRQFKLITLPSSPQAMCISTNKKVLYLSCLKKDTGSLIKYDIKSSSIIQHKTEVGGGSIIKYFPDETKLCVTSRTNTIATLQLPTLQLIHSIASRPNDIAVSVDSKYLLVGAAKSLQVYASGSGLPVKNTSYSFDIQDIIGSSSDRFYVGLHGSKKIITYTTRTIELIRDTADPDYEVIQFRENQRKFMESKDVKTKRQFISAFADSINHFVDVLQDTLGGEYFFSYGARSFDFKNNIYRINNMIVRNENRYKAIHAYYLVQFDGNEVSVLVSPTEYGSPLDEGAVALRVNYITPNWKDVKKQVRGYFMKKLKWLE